MRFAAAHPEATVFHHPAWVRVLAGAYGYEPGVRALQSDDGTILAALS
ncbi:MAG: hypothetical protein WCC30_12520 [Candidatus Dormiibacterota bacterium]